MSCIFKISDATNQIIVVIDSKGRECCGRKDFSLDPQDRIAIENVVVDLKMIGKRLSGNKCVWVYRYYAVY